MLIGIGWSSWVGFKSVFPGPETSDSSQEMIFDDSPFFSKNWYKVGLVNNYNWSSAALDEQDDKSCLWFLGIWLACLRFQHSSSCLISGNSSVISSQSLKLWELMACSLLFSLNYNLSCKSVMSSSSSSIFLTYNASDSFFKTLWFVTSLSTKFLRSALPFFKFVPTFSYRITSTIKKCLARWN